MQTIYFLKALAQRISKLILPSVSCTNTQIQIHKYTNTAYDKVPERPNKWHIFEKRIVQGYQLWCSHVSNAQIQKYKYTNTQIHKYSKWQSASKTQHVVYFWKEDWSGIPTMMLTCLKRTNTKYKYTNTQIHKYSNWQSATKPQHVVYFWKEDSSGVSNIIFSCVKCTNTLILYISCQQLERYL